MYLFLRSLDNGTYFDGTQHHPACKRNERKPNSRSFLEAMGVIFPLTSLKVLAKGVDVKIILRLHRIARITLSSEIIFNLWSIVLGSSVDHNIQPVLVKRESHLV
jgi:hypothetical protein